MNRSCTIVIIRNNQHITICRTFRYFLPFWRIRNEFIFLRNESDKIYAKLFIIVWLGNQPSANLRQAGVS